MNEMSLVQMSEEMSHSVQDHGILTYLLSVNTR